MGYVLPTDSNSRANTALTGLAKQYRRAFTLIVPFIIDSSVSVLDDDYLGRVNHLARWGFASAGASLDILDRTLRV